MRGTDIVRRAFRNLMRNSSRSRRTIISISIGICSIITMMALNVGVNHMSQKIQGQGNELLKVDVIGALVDGSNSIFPNVKGNAGRQINNEEINYLLKGFQDKVSYSYVKKLIRDFRQAEFNKYTVVTNTVAINLDALKKAPFRFYKGNNVKNINGAIVSRSLINHILLTEDWNNNVKGNFQKVDLLGKQIVFKIRIVNDENNGKRTVSNIDLPVRIDGILEDDKQYFDDTGGVMDEREPDSVFDYSVLYIPMERVKELESKYANINIASIEPRVTLFVNSIDNMTNVLKNLKDKNLQISSRYDNYIFMKYLSFTMRLIFGVLGVLILITSTIGIVNTMLMSVIERTNEIGIIKAVGVKINNIKQIFIAEASLIGLFGGILGVTASFIIVTIMNIFLGSNKNILGSSNGNIRIAEMTWYLVLGGIALSVFIGVIASTPAVWRAVKLNVSDALKKR